MPGNDVAIRDEDAVFRFAAAMRDLDLAAIGEDAVVRSPRSLHDLYLLCGLPQALGHRRNGALIFIWRGLMAADLGPRQHRDLFACPLMDAKSCLFFLSPPAGPGAVAGDAGRLSTGSLPWLRVASPFAAK